jgi:hypothetical protein
MSKYTEKTVDRRKGKERRKMSFEDPIAFPCMSNAPDFVIEKIKNEGLATIAELLMQQLVAKSEIVSELVQVRDDLNTMASLHNEKVRLIEVLKKELKDSEQANNNEIVDPKLTLLSKPGEPK